EYLRHVLRAAEQVDGLDDAGPLDDRTEDRVAVDGGEDAPDTAEVDLLQVLQGLVEVDVEGIRVARRIEQVPADVRRVDDVRRLDDRGQAHATVGDVQVVVGADAPPQPQDEADDAEIAAAVGREARRDRLGEEPPRLRRRERAEDCPEGTGPATNGERGLTTISLQHGGDRRAAVDLAAELPDPPFELVDERLVSAFQPAHQ